MEDPEILTVAKVAERLEVCERTVRRMVERGEFQVVNHGPLLFRSSEINAWLELQELLEERKAEKVHYFISREKVRKKKLRESREKERRENPSDAVIANKIGLSVKHVPKELLKLKRLQLQLFREAQRHERKQTKNNQH